MNEATVHNPFSDNRFYRRIDDPATAEIPPAILSKIIEETTRQIEARAARPSPFDLRTFEEIEAFAERVTRSNLCPKDFKGKPDDAIIAVLKGKEIGLPPMASLESIAVINGRPSIWGEAVPGLCLATGQVQDVVEGFEGEPGSDGFTAVCVVTRRGMTPREGRFSYGDVRQAGLKSVHLQYPKDMIMWRARHRAWHGAFPDTLRGLGTAELEAEEAARPVWTMPKPSQAWFAPPAVSADGWDNRWLLVALNRLEDIQSAWQWMEVLQDVLADAPTNRDLDELTALPRVRETIAAAPEDARRIIDTAIATAYKRFSDKATEANQSMTARVTTERAPQEAERSPGQNAAPPAEAATAKPETSEGAEFEAYLFDQIGEIVGEDSIRYPVSFASAIITLLAESGTARQAVLEHNADGIADARAASSKAADILAGIDELEEPEIAVIPLPDGRGGWGGYLKAFRAAIEAVSAKQFVDWLAAQEPVFGLASDKTRALVVKAAVDRAAALGITPPPGLAALLEPTRQGAPITSTATAAPDPAPASPAPANDPDAADNRAIDSLIAGLPPTTGTVVEITNYANGMIVRTLRDRLRREGKSDLLKRLDAAFEKRLAEIRETTR